MNKKNFALFIASITCILLVFNPSWVNGVDLTLTDPIQDISHWVDGVEIATNLATPTEIDIVSMEMNESIVAVTFVDTPVLHIDNFYDRWALECWEYYLTNKTRKQHRGYYC
ncbi:MAG: hypothetical protein ACTSO7_14820 [Candidatus Heimdallarchaeota archaeon]